MAWISFQVNHSEMDSNEIKVYWLMYELGTACLDAMATIAANYDSYVETIPEKKPRKRFSLRPYDPSDGRPPIFNSLINLGRRSSKSSEILKSSINDLGKLPEDTCLTTLDLKSGESVKNLSKVKEISEPKGIDSVTPLLAEESQLIFKFFNSYSIDFENIKSDVMLVTPGNRAYTFDDIKSKAISFLKHSVSLDTRGYTDFQLALFNLIINATKDIINHSEKDKVPELEKKDLEMILGSIERLMNKAPRYELQTSEISEKNLTNITKDQLITFVDKMIARNKYFERQRAKKHKGHELEDTVEKIWEISKRRFDTQCAGSYSAIDEKTNLNLFNEIIKIQGKNRIMDQQWVSKDDRKEQDFKYLQQLINRVDVQLDNQRYYTNDEKEKTMFLGKIQNHIDRMGGRISGQDALTKQGLIIEKFEEVERILNNAPRRYENQFGERRRSLSFANK